PLDAPLASWRALPDSRDAMHLLLPEVSGDRSDRWGESGILGAAYSTAPPSPCTLSAGGSSLLLLPAVLPGAAPGEFVGWRVVRRVAWRLTNGEGGWFLARPRFDAASGSASPACDGSQPVAGPFLSRAAGGLRLRPLAGDGTPLDAALQDS